MIEVTAIDPRHPNETCGQKPVNKTPIAGHPKIYLQLGAFSNRVNAEALAKRIEKHSKVPVFVNARHKPNREVYKVQLGPIRTVEEADALTERLEKEGFGTAFAVVR